MEDIRTASRLIQRHYYMATVDLRDAYFALPIQPSDRKYLRFFLDDFLLLASAIDECRTSVNFTVHLLESLGFTINTEKSILEPS